MCLERFGPFEYQGFGCIGGDNRYTPPPNARFMRARLRSCMPPLPCCGMAHVRVWRLLLFARAPRDCAAVMALWRGAGFGAMVLFLLPVLLPPFSRVLRAAWRQAVWMALRRLQQRRAAAAAAAAMALAARAIALARWLARTWRASLPGALVRLCLVPHCVRRSPTCCCWRHLPCPSPPSIPVPIPLFTTAFSIVWRLPSPTRFPA